MIQLIIYAKRKEMKFEKYFLLVLICCMQCGCRKLVAVDVPSNKIASGNVYITDATAAAALTGIYVKMASVTYGSGAVSIPTISMWAGLSADEFALWSSSTVTAVYQAYYKNNLSVNALTYYGSEFWVSAYSVIYSCNAAIEGLNSSSTLTPTVKNQLMGEAKFLRAFFYFYLVNLYGDTPLALSTDYNINASLSRSPKSKVYEQIIQDLKESQTLLTDSYMMSDAYTPYASANVAERVRPNRFAAIALLARAYLYAGDFTNAEIQADNVIKNTTYYRLLPVLNDVFLKNSMEAIWQLQPVLTGTTTNTAEAVQFLLTYAPVGLGTAHPVYLSPLLMNSFEPMDKRKINGNWVNVYTDISGTYYYPYKYKNATIGTGVTPTEYTMLLRVGEQYLIRAEARAQNGNLNGALADLDSVRSRAGLSFLPGSLSKQAILAATLHERQVELFTELGSRWLDLKRTNSIDTTMNNAASFKVITWNSYQQLYPVYAPDILKNINLTQNNGY